MAHVLTLMIGVAAADPPETPPPADPDAGRTIYERSCVACHGDDGAGAGALRAVNVKTRDLGGRWVTRVDDGYLEGVIRKGGTSVGRSPLMPAWGGVLSDADIRDVRAWLQTMATPEEPAPAVAAAEVSDER